jgi:hypothetical protein
MPMRELIVSGRLVDLILVLVALEFVVLVLHHRATQRGIASFDLLANLASGVCLLLALRAALSGASWIWIAVALGVSLLGHMLDLSRRLAPRWQWTSAPRTPLRGQTHSTEQNG